MELTTTKPFAGYTDFDDCVRKNQDQANPEAYCATIMRQAEKQEEESEPEATRGMVAFYPSPAIAQALASYTEGVPDAEEPDDYHITLAYFPEIEPEDRDALLQVVAHVAFMLPAPVISAIEGIARFLPSESSDGLVPHVAIVDPRGLEDIHEMVCAMASDVVEVSQNHGFVPHITLTYAQPDAKVDIDLPPALPLQFSELSLVIGDERHDFPLGGMTPMGVRPMYMSLLREKVADYENAPDDSARPPLASRTTAGTMTNSTVAEKAVWTTAYINDLPDSSFLYIEPGGKKVDGKTEPRSLRHFPVRGSDGAIDLPHLRNAISRLPQSNAPGLSPEKVQALQERARRMLEEASKSTEKAGKRLSSGWREKLGTAMETLRAMMQWADYEDEDDKPDEEDMGDMMKAVADSGSAFVVFKDSHGLDRWLAFSSNGFLDREDEIVSTKALEEAVDAADLSGKRGPLRLWHTPGADIGETDFQAVQGRFLIESGTFFEDEASQRAKQYFESTDEPLGVSIGFVYPESDFDGHVYKTVRFLERSVCPHWAVANPYTLFATLGKGEPMNSTKAAWLAEVVGEDRADQMLKTADAATKELEQHVAFKAEMTKEEAAVEEKPTEVEEKADPLLDALTAVKGHLPDVPEVKEAFSAFVKALDDSQKAKEEEKAPEAPDFVATLKDLLAPIATAVSGIGERISAVEGRLDANEAREKELTSNAPRGASVYRGTEATDNVIEESKAKGLWGDQPMNGGSPVKAYIEDIIRSAGGSGA